MDFIDRSVLYALLLVQWAAVLRDVAQVDSVRVVQQGILGSIVMVSGYVLVRTGVSTCCRINFQDVVR